MPEASSNFNNDLNDLVGNPPGWLLRSGLTVFAIVVLFVLALAAFIKYPDTISSAGIMTSTQPPIAHKALTTGLLDTLFVENNSHVKEGDTLIYLKTTALLKHVGKLHDFIIGVNEIEQPEGYQTLVFPSHLVVGQLQPAYTELELMFEEFILLLKNEDWAYQVKVKRHELNNTLKQADLLKRKYALSREELALEEKDFGKTKYLFDENLISELEYDQALAKVLGARKLHLSIETEINDNKLKLTKLTSELNEIKEERNRKVSMQLLKLKKLLTGLREQLSSWTLENVVTAQISGEIMLNSEINRYGLIDKDQILAHIIPSSSANVKRFVQAKVPAAGIGKINIGDQAMIKVEGFPYKEYGVITGVVETISLLPVEVVENEQQYELNISLSEGDIITTHGDVIPFNPQTAVLLDVITENKSILQRIFKQFLNLLNQENYGVN
ncbi:MAG: hypothetical protein AAF620_08125 [Bacteroidota bacterium]